MWGRRNIGLDQCPKPYITAESRALLEEYLRWKRLRVCSEELSARQVEAFLLLEKELAAELVCRRRER